MEGVQVQDIKLCSECKKTCIEPRSLNCFHSFCLRCVLQSIKGKNIKAEKELACPVCNKPYIVPKEGLRRNDFIYRKINLDEESSPSNKDRTLCRMCSKGKENSECQIPLATAYCIECEKEMCDRCKTEHSRQRSSNTHTVFGLGRQDDDDLQLAKHKGNHCQEHPKKQVELYCKRCKVIICITCFVETHKCHDCIDLDKYRDQLRNQIEKNCEKTNGCLESCRTMRDRLESVEREFLESADAAKANIDERCEELKKMIDKHAKKLQEELERKKKRKLEQISEHRETLDKLIADLKTFKAYCSELASKGTSLEITRDVARINERKTELQHLQEKQAGREIGSVNFFFKPQELENYQQDMDNIVGSIEAVATRVMKRTVILDSHSDVVLGVAKLKDSIYILYRSLSSISIHVANYFDPDLLKQEALLAEVSSPIDMVASEANNCLYVSDRGNRCIWKLSPDLRPTRWMSWVHQPMTMSISKEGHVIMAKNTNPPIVDLYGSRGELVDQSRIPVFLLSPKHVVETSTGDFVVLHRFRDFGVGGKLSWGVSRVNRDGKVVCRFVPSDVTQMLCRPHRLTIDDDDRVFVVDPGAARLTMLGSNLVWIKNISTKGYDKICNHPLTLCYDKRKKRFLVGDKFSGVCMLTV